MFSIAQASFSIKRLQDRWAGSARRGGQLTRQLQNRPGRRSWRLPKCFGRPPLQEPGQQLGKANREGGVMVSTAIASAARRKFIKRWIRNLFARPWVTRSVSRTTRAAVRQRLCLKLMAITAAVAKKIHRRSSGLEEVSPKNVQPMLLIATRMVPINRATLVCARAATPAQSNSRSIRLV